MFKMLNCSAAF